MLMKAQSLFVLIQLLTVSGIAYSDESNLPSHLFGGSCTVVDEQALVEGEFPVTFHNIVIGNTDSYTTSNIQSCNQEKIPSYISFATESATSRINTNDEYPWRYIENPVELTVKSCSLIKHNNVANKLLILESDVNAAKIEKGIFSVELLSFISLGKGGIPDNLLIQFVSIDTATDNRNRVTIKHICNFDDDSDTEIIVNDKRYAGAFVQVCDFSGAVNSFKCKYHKVATEGHVD